MSTSLARRIAGTSFRQKLLLLAAVNAALVALLAAASWHGIATLSAATREQVQAAELLRNQMNADMLHDTTKSTVVSALLAASTGSVRDSAATRAALVGDLQEVKESMKRSLAAIAAASISAESRMALQRVQPDVQRYLDLAATIVAGAFTDRAAAMASKPDFERQFDSLEESLAGLGDSIEADIKAAGARATAAGNAALWWLLGAAVVGLATMIAVSALIGRSIVNRTEAASRYLQRIGSGDFDSTIVADGQDEVTTILTTLQEVQSKLQAAARQTATFAAQVTEISRDVSRRAEDIAAGSADLSRRIDEDGKSGELRQLCAGVNNLLGVLSSLVHSMQGAAGAVSSGADEITHGNTDLRERTERQAANLEEAAASLEQMTATVRNTADNAGQANELAITARGHAEAGGQVVKDAVAAMGRINESSRRIADIIGVIDDIAFQTNLLALNAAVEAARAGEQGRGFAVVAAEVRNLAGRSSTAAREIKTLIGDSSQRVEEGTRLVALSGSTLDEIVAEVRRVGEIIADIANATAEQSAGIGQVNEAVTMLDEVTQQNASLVEQVSAASESMAGQARDLTQSLNGYRNAGGKAAAQAAGGAGGTARNPAASFRAVA